MRRVVQLCVLAAAAAAIALVFVGLTSAADMRGTSGKDRIEGTDGADKIDGTPYADFVVPFDGADTIRTYGGDDFVNGGNDTGRDVFWFGAGDDSVRERDGIVDTIHCGPGYDRVTADEIDVVADDCEFLGDFDF